MASQAAKMNYGQIIEYIPGKVFMAATSNSYHFPSINLLELPHCCRNSGYSKQAICLLRILTVWIGDHELL
jgi:hypothetical protein